MNKDATSLISGKILYCSQQPNSMYISVFLILEGIDQQLPAVNDGDDFLITFPRPLLQDGNKYVQEQYASQTSIYMLAMAVWCPGHEQDYTYCICTERFS